ncbi:TolC family protein, partial [Staphylococcus aureus]
MALGHKQHPAIAGAAFDIDVAQLAVSIAEGSLLPTATLQGSISRGRDTDPTLDKKGLDQASIVGQVTVPIYDGG